MMNENKRKVGFMNEEPLVSDALFNAEVYEIGVYGWRKRFLYVLLVLLTVSVIVNAIMTIWIIRLLKLSTLGIGMGSLRLHSRGLTLHGDAFVAEDLFVASINGYNNSKIKIESKDNITLNVRSETGELKNRISLNGNTMESFVNQFAIRSPDGKLKLLVDKDNLFVDKLNLRIKNNAGITINGSIQTSFVKSYLTDSLRLISPTRNVSIKAATGLVIESMAAGIAVTSLKDLSLKSSTGKVILEGTEFVFNGLQVGNSDKNTMIDNQVYQVCACGRNGKLFLAESDSQCFYDPKLCIDD